MDRCQIAHFNYVGDSILGIHAHFAAGSIISNYKLDGSLIKIQKRVE
jgi:bifunctional N-acetylglucosamine-1-phosphate-uridyltransferase/glucosamine-1-phosphate-acetyltransferase GlmU-like protein